MINRCYTKGGKIRRTTLTEGPEERKGGKESEPLQMMLSFDPLRIQEYVTGTSIWEKRLAEMYCLSGSLRGKEYTEMKTEEAVYRELYAELENYERRGVDIMIDGYQASPLQIVTAYMTREEGAYMRDYVMDVKGNIETLAFTDIQTDFSEFQQTENTP